MKVTKRKSKAPNLRLYWQVFLPLTLILALMVKFPLRIDVRELFYDMVFYGTISLICVATAIQLYRQVGKSGYRLIAVVVLCCILSGWQIFDLYVLRTGSPSVYGFGNTMSRNFTDNDGLAWYGLRFPSDKIMCHSLYEQFYGNYMIAITVEIRRDATWFACGG